jgi:hypothetical protein
MQKSPARGRASYAVVAPITHKACGERCEALVLFLADLLAIPLTCEGFLHALLFAGLQVKGVALNFLNDVFLLHLALEAAKRVLEGLTLLQTNFCQCKNTPLSGHAGRLLGYAKKHLFRRLSGLLFFVLAEQ